MKCLVFLEIAIGVTVGVVEFHGVGAACGSGEGDNNHGLHAGIHNSVVDNTTCAVVD